VLCSSSEQLLAAWAADWLSWRMMCYARVARLVYFSRLPARGVCETSVNKSLAALKYN